MYTKTRNLIYLLGFANAANFHIVLFPLFTRVCTRRVAVIYQISKTTDV